MNTLGAENYLRTVIFKSNASNTGSNFELSPLYNVAMKLMNQMLYSDYFLELELIELKVKGKNIFAIK